MMEITGQKVPKAKAGINAVESALFKALEIAPACYAAMRDTAKDKIKAMI